MGKAVLLGLAGAGLFLASLDAYVVVTLLPAMSADVGLTIEHFEQATPIVTGFLGGYVVAMPLLGAYSDVKGRAPVYALCMAVFAGGSAMTATAGTAEFSGLPWMVVGRTLQGLGGGGLVPLSLALAADLYPSAQRTLALGLLAGLQEAGSVIGPVYGATLAAAAASFGGWRFVFWLNLPLAAICAVALLIGRRRATPGMPTERAGGIDWASAALLAGGLGAMVVALYPDDPTHRAIGVYFVPAGIGAVLLLAGYVLRQYTRLTPFIPRDLLRSRGFIGSSIANLLVGVALMVVLVDVPVLGRAVFGLDQLGSGLLLTHFLIGVPAGAVLGGLMAGRAGGRFTATLGMLIAAIAFFQMSTWQSNELSLQLGPFHQSDVALGTCGLGFGIVIAPLAAAVLDRTRSENHGLAASLVVLSRTMGMLIGLSVLTAFGLYRFRQILGTPNLTEPDLDSRIAHLGRLVSAAFLQEYREIFTIAAGLCVISGLVAVMTLGAVPRTEQRRA